VLVEQLIHRQALFLGLLVQDIIVDEIFQGRLFSLIERIHCVEKYPWLLPFDVGETQFRSVVSRIGSVRFDTN